MNYSVEYQFKFKIAHAKFVISDRLSGAEVAHAKFVIGDRLSGAEIAHAIFVIGDCLSGAGLVHGTATIASQNEFKNSQNFYNSLI